MDIRAIKRLRIAEGLMLANGMMGNCGEQSPQDILHHINSELTETQRKELRGMVDWVEEYSEYETLTNNLLRFTAPPQLTPDAS